MTKYIVNIDFLDKWTPELAWWLGLFYGDGNSHKKESHGTYRIGICGCKKNVEDWIRLVSNDKPFTSAENKKCYFAHIDNKEFYFKIKDKFGIDGPKTETLEWPKDMPEELDKFFIRGLIDSDGWISCKAAKNKGVGVGTVQIGYTTAAPGFTDIIAEKILKHTGIKCITNKVKTPRLPAYRLDSRSWDSIKIMSWIYDGGPELYNPSKKETYLKALELEKLRHLPREKKEKPLIECSCGKQASRKGMCIACYTRQRRAEGKQKRVSTGTCSCGKPCFRKSMCDKCYTKTYREKLPEPSKILSKIKTIDCINDVLDTHMPQGVSVWRKFHPQVDYANNKSNISVAQALKDPVYIQKAQKLQEKYGHSTGDKGIERAIRAIVKAPSNFNPAIAKYLIQTYMPKDKGILYDPFCGYGGRLLGAAASGRVSHYIGIDIEKDQVIGNTRMAEWLNQSASFFCEDASKKNNIKADMLLTDPPYYDVENYGDSFSKHISSISTYEEWLKTVICPIIDSSFAIPVVIFSVAPFKRGKEVFNLPEDIRAIMSKYREVKELKWLKPAFGNKVENTILIGTLTK